MVGDGLRAVALLAVAMLGCGTPGPPVRQVRLAMPHAMVSLDPHAQNDGVTGTVLAAVYDGLVLKVPGEPVEPLVADRWTTPDDLTWRFRLRPGVTFHDGRPVTVDDVVASLRRARFGEASALATYIEPIREVLAADEDGPVVEIRTAEPFPQLLPRLGMVAITPAAGPADPPVGTGPYRWVDGDVGGPVHLRRWEGFWGQPAPIEQVEIQFVASEDRLASLLERGQLDVVASISEQLARRFADREGWRQQQIPAVATTILGLRVTDGPLADAGVREAIDLAIDRERLVAEAFPDEAVEPATTLAAPEVFGFTVQAVPTRVDPERARRLVVAAGGEDLPPIRLDYSNVSVGAIHVVTRMLDRVGLRVLALPHPYAVFYRRIEEGLNEAYAFSWNFALGDPSGFLESMAHSRAPARGLGLLNGTGFGDPELDAWVEQASREPVSARRLELVQWSFARLAAARPYLPLYHRPRIALVRRPFRLQVRSGSWVRPQEIALEE